MTKEEWIAQEFTPFDQGCRERFFLAATSYLFTNAEKRLTDGYYFEFGTHKGRTMRYCWRHTQHNFNLTYVAFDSFQGLPEIEPIDRHPGWSPGDFCLGEDEFVECVVQAGMPRDRLVTVRGFYAESLTESLASTLLPRRASLVYVDCDLYRSTVPVLVFAQRFLQRGTVIAFDDWNCFCADPERGQRRAWREFRESAPHLDFEPFYSTHMMQSFVCVRGPED